MLLAGGDEQVHAIADNSGWDRVLGIGELRLCGTMTSPAVAQANCFDSTGRDGFGEMDPNDTWPTDGFQREFQLSDVGWAGTVGKTVPITGRYETVDAQGGKTGKLGTFLALLQMQGGAACADGWNGAVWFVAAGVVAFLPA